MLNTPNRRRTGRERLALLLAGLCFAGLGSAVASAQDSQDLAKQLANPIANLMSFPLQINYDEGFGPNGDGERVLTNFQPVIPIKLSDDWLVISRTILPIVWQDDVVPFEGEQFGLSDTTQSLFLSPKEPGPFGLIWGAGPVFLLPTATEDTLGSEKWGAGPTVVGLMQHGPWTYGVLANHVWSFAGDHDRADVSSTFVQPFLNYTTSTATTIFLNAEASYDWETDQASIPINLGVNQLFKIGGQAFQIGAGVRYWADSPDGGPDDFGFRINLVALFPTS
ncbi:MAG: transporter [Dongiaceae bacterium]